MPKKRKSEIAAVSRDIRGIPYPAKKSDVIEYVRASGTGNKTLDIISRLSREEYANETEILDELESNPKKNI